MCSFGPEAVLAVHSDVEGPDEAKGAGHDLEENVPAFGLAVLSDDLDERRSDSEVMNIDCGVQRSNLDERRSKV